MDFISRKDVLELFSISAWTLRRWQKERQFPDAICASGQVRMYRKSEVEGWVEAQANPLNTHKSSSFSGGKYELA